MHLPSLTDPAEEAIGYFRVLIYARWATLVPSVVVIAALVSGGLIGIAFLGVGGLMVGVFTVPLGLALGAVMWVWYRRRRRHPFGRPHLDLRDSALRPPLRSLLMGGPMLLFALLMGVLLLAQPTADPALFVMDGILIAMPLIVFGPALWGYPRHEQIVDRYFARHPDQLRALRDSIARSQTVGEAMYRLASWTPQR